MSTPIDFLPPIVDMRPALSMDAAGGGAKSALPVADSGFTTLVTAGLRAVNSDWMQAQEGIRGLAAGGSGNLHDVMIRLEESRTSFQLFLQVRNRLVESYQDVMRMQI